MLAAVRGDRDRSAGARGPRPRPPRARSRRRSARARGRAADRATSPARRSAVTRIAVACGPSSASGRLRCSRTPRSTCAIAREPEALDDVDEQPELDAPPLDERHASRARRGARRTHPRAAARSAASCGNSVEISGRATSSVTRPPPLGLAVERAPVEALHERDVGLGEERAEQPGHEVRRRSCGCRRRPSRGGRPPRRRATSTSRCPCRSPGPVSGSTSSTATTRAPSHAATSAVASVEPSSMHDDLVDEGDRLHEGAPDGGHDVADGGLLVPGREAHRDREALARPWPRRARPASKSWRPAPGQTGSSATAPSVGPPGPHPGLTQLARAPGGPCETSGATTRSSRAAEGRAR